MVGLSASALAPEALRAGEQIEYYSRGFVAGDPRGLWSAIVLRVDGTRNADFPIRVDTGELLPRDMMMRRITDRDGSISETKWRKLRTFQLVQGTFNAPSRASAFAEVLETVIRTAYKATRSEIQDMHEGNLSTYLEAEDEATHIEDTSFADVEQSSACTTASDALEVADTVSTRLTEDHASEETDLTPPRAEESAVGLATAAPTDREVLNAEEYLRSIPNRHARAKIRHQKKRRAGDWHVNRPRKRRDQAKCAITRSGAQIHHARTVMAQNVQKILAMPGVKFRLIELRERRPNFVVSKPPTTVPYQAVGWRAGIERIETNETPSIAFRDIGDFGSCSCSGDCFLHTCDNAVSAVYCTEDNCKLRGLCSNSPRPRSTLRLFKTARVGLGVFTTTDLDVGDIVAEYTGDLSEFDAIFEGQPDAALKENSGYTLLLNTKSTRRKYVYVDAVKRGSIARFISHSCIPNAIFDEVQNRKTVKVLVRMLEDVKGGAQITVNYEKERWFKCSCDECWRKEGILA